MNHGSVEENAPATGQPRVLLAEDDGISRDFLIDALERLPARVTAAVDGDQAIRLLGEEHYQLAILDRRLPRHDALSIREAVLAGSGPNLATPMLALSADIDPELRQRFLAAGFIDLLAKPIAASVLRTAVRSALPDDIAVWDAEQALAAANGNVEIVTRLRQLLLDDLPGQREQVLAALACNDRETAHDVLHRLKAACAFCGAARLAAACAAVDDAIQGSAPAAEAIGKARMDFRQACQEILDAGGGR